MIMLKQLREDLELTRRILLIWFHDLLLLLIWFHDLVPCFAALMLMSTPPLTSLASAFLPNLLYEATVPIPLSSLLYVAFAKCPNRHSLLLQDVPFVFFSYG